MEERIPSEITEGTSFEASSVNSALTRIKNTLNYSLKENYGIEDEEITNNFLKLHGLDKGRFDFINNFEKLIEKGIADESVDTNANKHEVSITGFFNETAMPINKLVGYRYLYRKMKDMYGKKRAKYLAGLLYDMSLMMHDSSNILKPYCWSINASKLVLEGRPWGTLPSGIPHRVSSYISALTETVHGMSNHLAGAIAVGSFFLDVAHVYIYREHKTLADLQKPEELKYIENCFQSFIHSMNHLSRGGVESPFTNISIFDPPKLRGLLSTDNMGWYFDKDDIMDGTPTNALMDCGDEDWNEYIIKMILVMEDCFANVMDRGDVLHDNRPIEFPVLSLNITRKEKEDGTFEFEDYDYVKHFCDNHDIVRYNIYMSSGLKISSCCRLINDSEMFELGGQVNSFGGTALSLGSHRVIAINFRRLALISNTYDEFKNNLMKRMEDTADILIAHRSLLKDMVDKGTQPFVTNGWIDLDRMFSTFGLIGYVEASEDMKVKFGEHDYLSDIVTMVEDKAKALTAERHNVFNTEQVPAESASVRLAKADRWLFGEDKVPEKLYANQFVPLWEDVTLHEKFEREGELADKLSGGGIIHYSCGERVTPKQALYIINEAMKCKVGQFAINPTYSVCKNEHFVYGNHDICPRCSEPSPIHFTRTVGFFTFTNDWSTEKREYDYKRRHYKESGNFEV